MRSRKIAEKIIGTDGFWQMTSTSLVSIEARDFLVVVWLISAGAGVALLVVGIKNIDVHEIYLLSRYMRHEVCITTRRSRMHIPAATQTALPNCILRIVQVRQVWSRTFLRCSVPSASSSFLVSRSSFLTALLCIGSARSQTVTRLGWTEWDLVDPDLVPLQSLDTGISQLSLEETTYVYVLYIILVVQMQ